MSYKKDNKGNQDAVILQEIIVNLEFKMVKKNIKEAGSGSEKHEEKHKCFNCGQYGHMKPNWPKIGRVL